MDQTKRMKELVRLLNQAAKAYYQEDREIMSNLDYDRLYDELVELEKQTGTVLANSPTVQVGCHLRHWRKVCADILNGWNMNKTEKTGHTLR